MRIRWTLLTVAVLSTYVTGQAMSRPPAAGDAADRQKATKSLVSIVRQQTGELALVVNYPWQIHQRPSVEIRLVTGDRANLSEVHPLFFVKEFFKGAVTVNVYHCQDRAAGVPLRRSVTEKGIELEIIGRRNALERPSVCVARHIPADDPAPGSGAVFCLLPPWAINKGLLHLELPQQYFAEPGKLYVWFLRDGEVIWEEQTDWPGIQNRASPK